MWEGETLYAPSVWAAYNSNGAPRANSYNCSAPQEEERRLHEIMLRVRHTLTLERVEHCALRRRRKRALLQ